MIERDSERQKHEQKKKKANVAQDNVYSANEQFWT